MKPGNIVLVEFRGALGVKRRPAVVVSSDTYHSNRPDVILGVITSNIAAAAGPTDHVLRDWASAGLKKPSAFRAYLGTYEQSDVGVVIGQLTSVDLDAIRGRLSIAFGLDN
jgi:mRNA interferase MazF